MRILSIRTRCKTASIVLTSCFRVVLIEKYKLDPSQCVFVGDMTTDKSFAARIGFQYQDHNVFFK